MAVQSTRDVRPDPSRFGMLPAMMVTYATLIAFIVVVYAGTVVGIGGALGTGGRPNLALSIVAATIVALTFEPVRRWAERIGRRVTGSRAVPPYEVLSRFAEQMTALYPSYEALPVVARLLAEGASTAGVEVWVRNAGAAVRIARWPDTAAPVASAGPDGELEVDPGSAWLTPVRHRGDQLATLVAVTVPGRRPTRRQRRILADLAVQVGLTLRNIALVHELNASRQRLVTAQDAERRAIEEAIRDRVGRRLSAVNAALSMPGLAIEADELRMLSLLRSDAAAAQRELEDLARGVFPPVLLSRGVVPALTAHADGSPLSVVVEAEDVSRYQPAVEAAVYFCCLEALQNVAKHANARTAVVRLWVIGGRLHFSVQDDGAGFRADTSTAGSGVRNMTDRIEALGGQLEIRSSPTAGTTVVGWLPIDAAELNS